MILIKADLCHVYVLFILLCSGLVFTSQLPLLKRQLLKNGFHRDLLTTMELPLTLFSHGDIQCSSICSEHLPVSVYVDKFQLKSISSHDVEYVAPTLDIEQPEYQENTFSVFPVVIYSKVHVGTDRAVINVTTPIHLRYHLPSTDYRNFSIMNPQILIHCHNANFIGKVLWKDALPCTSESQKMCSWSIIKYSMDKKDIEVKVPVGNTSHMMLAVIVTLAVTFGSCFWIILKVVRVKSEQTQS